MKPTDLKGKTFLITGANSGIGKETARTLAEGGGRVIMLCRSQTRGEKARQEISRPGGGQIDLLQADFSSLAEVRQAARTIKENYDQIDVLINNAGVMMMKRELSADGFEATFAINHLAHFLLTNELLTLLEGAPEGRVVTVASDVHYNGKIDFDNLNLERNFSGMTAYSQSKLANILFSRELARRLTAAGSSVTSNALHPGFVGTNIGKNNGFLYKAVMSMMAFFIKSPADGAQTSIYLATSPEVAGSSGLYFADCRPKEPAPLAQDDALAARLWSHSAELVGLNSIDFKP